MRYIAVRGSTQPEIMVFVQDGKVYRESDRGRLWPERVWHTQPDGSIIGWFRDIKTRPPIVLFPVHPSDSKPDPKPPLGLRPDYIAYREQDAARCVEIAEAIKRYAEALVPIPDEWITELNDLIEINQPTKETK